MIAGVLVLVPALAHGTFLGPYDILQNAGLNKTPNVEVHNPTLLDQIRLFIPWTNQVWTQVHQGHLPLWNPYSALGMPLAFNWESAPLSLPVLIGYLFPVRLAYTAQVVVTMVIAGTGVYVLGKVLRLGTLGCMTAAIVFELSGAFMGNIGWPLSSVWSWGGWVFAAMVLVLRGEKRAQAMVLLGIVIAFAFYAGNPEDQALLALTAAIFASAMLLFRAPALGGSGPVIRPAVDLGISAIAGTALAAPLILPGLQLARGSNRTVVGPDLFPKGLPPKELVHLIFQGFDGLPVLHSQWFGLSAYEVTSAYVGVIVLVLAATALAVRWRRPEVRSFALVAVAMGLLVFAPPLVSFLDSSGARIYWIFAMTPMVLAVAGGSLRYWDGRLGQVPQRAASSACARHRIRRDGGFARDHLASGPARTYARAGEHPLAQLYLAHYRGGCRAGSGVDVDESGHSDSDAPGFVRGPRREHRRVVSSPCGDRFPRRFGCPSYLIQLRLPNLDSSGHILTACRW